MVVETPPVEGWSWSPRSAATNAQADRRRRSRLHSQRRTGRSSAVRMRRRPVRDRVVALRAPPTRYRCALLAPARKGSSVVRELTPRAGLQPQTRKQPMRDCAEARSLRHDRDPRGLAADPRVGSRSLSCRAAPPEGRGFPQCRRSTPSTKRRRQIRLFAPSTVVPQRSARRATVNVNWGTIAAGRASIVRAGDRSTG
jgi:hypothetical protein